MKTKKNILPVYILLLALVVQACNLPGAQATETADPLLAAQMTITALSQNQPVEPSATLSVGPVFSSTPELTFTPAFTGTPTFAYITLSQATNCRVGADVSFELIDTFQVGQTIQVLGKHPFDNYWYVKSPNNPNVNCWMWGQYATGANLDNVPVLAPPATYTPQPTATTSGGIIIIGTIVIKPVFTLAYVNSGKCAGWWSRITINNTGAVTAKSIAISIKDTVTNEVRNSSTNGFQDVSGCALSAAKPTLAAGESTTVVAPSFTADPAGHNVSATVTLCTDVNSGGACSSSTIEFVP
jgi:hypothetical protein